MAHDLVIFLLSLLAVGVAGDDLLLQFGEDYLAAVLVGLQLVVDIEGVNFHLFLVQ